MVIKKTQFYYHHHHYNHQQILAPHSTAVLKSPSDLCNSHFKVPIDLLILVHSATDHFAQRVAIREFSSSSQSRFGGQHWRTVFVLGKTAANNSSIERAISEEHRSFGDLLQGDFLDSYRNLTVKHLFGLGWTVQQQQQQQQQKCSSIRAVLKVDDDIFVNYYRLAALLKQSNFLSNSSSSSSSTPSLLCYLHRRMPVNRDRGSSQFSSKWSVTREEFSEAYYPPFCSGWAYLTTPETIIRWLCAVPKTRFFWIDDVYVTGMLRKSSCPGSGQERRGVQPINHLYSVDPGQVASWLQEKEEGY
ncbi:hypothetical protein TYRP_002549 [Tyrophagus putrescentiae]|nr:hypothetical protein TYRP_002549 [Tyrophagus putrescentiae]